MAVSLTMDLKIINIVLLMCVCLVVSQNASSCCPKGQGFLNKMCVDPSTKRRLPMEFSCRDKYRSAMAVLNEKYSNFTVNKARQLVIMTKNREDVVFDADTFCICHSSHYDRRVAVLCHEKPDERVIDENLNYCFMIVSSVFLLATGIVYSTRRELRDIHGMSIINFCGSFAIGLAILAGMNLVPYSDMTLCAVRGFLAYFFMIVSFFWMNVLSIQILFKLRHFYLGFVGDYEKKSLVWYAAYAWGCPAVLTTLMAIVNFMPGDHLKPGIGLDTCWFFDKKQQWIYMYSVMSVLIVMNICIFIYATVLLWGQSRPTEAIRYKFLTTVQLFIVMGVPWIFEMVSSLPPHRNFIWEVLDLINTLQGVLIFLVLCGPLLPLWTSRTDLRAGVQYNMNIKIEQPYKKFVG